MGIIATHQDVSTFAGGGILPTDGNMCATKSWIESNFSNVGINGVYDANQLVELQHLVKKDLEVISIIVDGNNIPLQKFNGMMWGNADTVEVSSFPNFTVVIKVANVGERNIYPLFDMEGISNIQFNREYVPGDNDTATITYRDIYVKPDWNGTHEATFSLANEMSPNYGEIYAQVFFSKLTFI